VVGLRIKILNFVTKKPTINMRHVLSLFSSTISVIACLAAIITYSSTATCFPCFANAYTVASLQNQLFLPSTKTGWIKSTSLSNSNNVVDGANVVTVSENLESLVVLSKTKVGGGGGGSNNKQGGFYHRIQHQSKATDTTMTFGLFLPSSYDYNNDKSSSSSTTDTNTASATPPPPTMYWLSGLTCDDTNFAQKAGAKAFDAAEKEGIAIIIPDVSPRGENVVDDDAYDLGQGAGFYVDATEDPFATHYRMRSYITSELPQLLIDAFQLDGPRSISGHSMGGHGALSIAFEDPSSWTSVSAFAPICNPTDCPWGEKSFTNYLGSVKAGKPFDATCILADRTGPIAEFDDILIDQGTNDEFLVDSAQLKPDSLMDAAQKCGQKITMNMRSSLLLIVEGSNWR